MFEHEIHRCMQEIYNLPLIHQVRKRCWTLPLPITLHKHLPIAVARSTRPRPAFLTCHSKRRIQIWWRNRFGWAVIGGKNHEPAAARIPLGWMCAWVEKVYVGQIGTGTTHGINPCCYQLKSLLPQARMRRLCGSTNVSCFFSNWCGFDFIGSVKVIHLKVKPTSPANYKEVQS